MDDESASCTTPSSQGRNGIALRWIQRTAVLEVSGDLDMLTAPALTDAIAAAAAHGPLTLIVDLSGLDFLASAGMNVLVTAQDELAAQMRFGVVADGPATGRPLRIIGIDQLVPLYRRLTDALTDMAGTQPTTAGAGTAPPPLPTQ